MTYYLKLSISTNDIAGAVAMEALHDLRVNKFMFSGFPAIEVSDLSDGVFVVHLRCGRENEYGVSFSLMKKDAVAAAKQFKKGERTEGKLFEVVQKALVELEGKAQKSR